MATLSYVHKSIAARRRRLWAWLSERQLGGHVPPSYREIQQALGYAAFDFGNPSNTAERDLMALEECGLISRVEGRARTTRVVVPRLTMGVGGVRIVANAAAWREGVNCLPEEIRRAYRVAEPVVVGAA